MALSGKHVQHRAPRPPVEPGTRRDLLVPTSTSRRGKTTGVTSCGHSEESRDTRAKWTCDMDPSVHGCALSSAAYFPLAL